MRDTYRYVLLVLVALLALAAIFLLARQPSLSLPVNNASVLPPAPTSTVSGSGNMIVTSPLPNDSVLHDFVITGRARVFENQFSWRVLDLKGAVLASGSAYAYAPDVGQFGDFDIPVRLPVSATFGTDRIILETFDHSAKDGSVIDLAQVPVTLSDAPATTLKVYFNNSLKDPEGSCNKVYPVERFMLKTQAPAQAAIRELLQGPTPAEKAQGYFTSIPEGSALNSIKITNGVAEADFNAQTESGGGSCSMAARTAEIRQTLLQFPTIRSVELSINGRTGDIFQP